MDLFSVETSIKVKHMVMVPYRIWMDLLITEIFKTEKLVGKEVWNIQMVQFIKVSMLTVCQMELENSKNLMERLIKEIIKTACLMGKGVKNL
jgi:hypothetical protein